MYHILLPIKKTESRARAQVETVLDCPMAADDIAIDIIHVHDEAVANVKWAAGETFSKTYTEEMTEQVPEINRIPSSVDAAVDILESTDIEFTVHERSGNPAEEILKIADELDSDRIVLGVGGQSVVGKVLFGSVAQAVILSSDRPVTVVPERASES